jgi:hypothetical protein
LVANRPSFGADPLTDLRALIDRRTAIVSIDTDFFIQEDERLLAGKLEGWLEDKVSAGVRVTCRENHVDLVDLFSEPVDVVLNFDTHMDLSLGFLFGAPPRVPPEDASVFETILESDFTDRYVWAHPVSRSRDAARVYSAALLFGDQPILRRIHCLEGALAFQLLDSIRTEWVFVCRSPAYASPRTELTYRRLCSIANGPSPASLEP